MTDTDRLDALAAASEFVTIDPATIRELVAAVRERDALQAAAEDHIPSGGESMDGYGYVECSCGWSDDGVGGWAEHIRAALHREDGTRRTFGDWSDGEVADAVLTERLDWEARRG